MKRYLFCLFTALFAVSASAYELQRVSVHDPSIVWEPNSKTYYIFGSHRAVAKTTDLMSWTTVDPVVSTSAFTTPAAWSKRGSTNYDVSGNLWAPDVIWNKAMKKWCMYMSVNGDNWYSSIVLLTSDNIEGP